jgi:enoyl-CoA hydratase/carnithine racemase
MPEFEALLLEQSDGVAIITLNRPEVMNAWTGRMAHELEQALLECDGDPQVRAIVITGAGRAFCAGADLSGGGSAFAGEPKADAGQERGGDFPDRTWPFQLSKPVIAAINGHAIGVGITLPMTCDLRYVAEEAKLQFAFVQRGVIPELGSHAIVPRVVGLSRAADLMLTGRIFRGREAAELGLASAALPAEQVLPAAIAKAREFAAAAPVSVALTKRLLWEGMGLTAHEMMGREAPLFSWVGRQPDAREGVVSFMEKRAPEWSLDPARDAPEGL